MIRSGKKSNPYHGRSGRGGLTLVELLVSIGVLLVVMGLAYSLMFESERATREITHYQAGVQYCQNVLSETVRTLRGAAAPANFTGLPNPALLKPKFTREEISLIACDRFKASHFNRVSIMNEMQGKRSAGIQRRITPLADTATSSVQTEDLGGIRPEHFEPSIHFKYAAAPVPAGTKGLEIVYKDEWTTTALPALVQVTVQARLESASGQRKEISLQTAVIPGLLPAGSFATAAAIQPAPPPPSQAAPAPAPSPKAQPANPPPPQKALKVLPASENIKVIDREKLDRLKAGNR